MQRKPLFRNSNRRNDWTGSLNHGIFLETVRDELRYSSIACQKYTGHNQHL